MGDSGIDWAGGLAGGWAGGLVLGAADGLIGGLITSGANNGGWYICMQRLFRRQAVREGLLPQDIAAFLMVAVDARILRRTGGGAQFRHRMLTDRLAQEAPTPGLADLRQRFGTDRT